MAGLAVWRAFLLWRFEVLGWEAWLAGAVVLLGTAALMLSFSKAAVGSSHGG
jgi:hypothetical protein